MKFQNKLLTRTPFRTVCVAVARKPGNPTSPQVQIFGAKIDQFLNEILNLFAPNFGNIKLQVTFKRQRSFNA
jgi:hypothetical protein